MVYKADNFWEQLTTINKYVEIFKNLTQDQRNK